MGKFITVQQRRGYTPGNCGQNGVGFFRRSFLLCFGRVANQNNRVGSCPHTVFSGWKRRNAV